MLFTRKNQHNEQMLSYRDLQTIRNSYFNKYLPLKIIVHGFGNNRDTPWAHNMKNAILNVNLKLNILFRNIYIWNEFKIIMF